jgi:hypothetical protein
VSSQEAPKSRGQAPRTTRRTKTACRAIDFLVCEPDTLLATLLRVSNVFCIVVLYFYAVGLLFQLLRYLLLD